MGDAPGTPGGRRCPACSIPADRASRAQRRGQQTNKMMRKSTRREVKKADANERGEHHTQCVSQPINNTEGHGGRVLRGLRPPGHAASVRAAEHERRRQRRKVATREQRHVSRAAGAWLDAGGSDGDDDDDEETLLMTVKGARRGGERITGRGRDYSSSGIQSLS